MGGIVGGGSVSLDGLDGSDGDEHFVVGVMIV
jgi:hypothetical protein